MSNYIRYAISAALLGIIAKMSYFLWFRDLESMDNAVRLSYLLFFLVALFFGLRSFQSGSNKTAFTDDVKTGMKVTSVFALIITAFTYVYYAFIHPSYFENMRATRIAAAPEAQVEAITSNVEFIFSPFIHSTITLMGLMVIGFFYTIILVLILRAVPRSIKG